jgi:hypothetical protein
MNKPILICDIPIGGTFKTYSQCPATEWIRLYDIEGNIICRCTNSVGHYSCGDLAKFKPTEEVWIGQ